MYHSQDYSIINPFINYRIEETLELPMNNYSSGDGSQSDNDQERFFLDMDSINKKDNTRKGFDNRKKKFILDDDIDDIDDNSWINKPINDWSQSDTINWLMYAASRMGQLYSSIQNNFALPGKDLLLLSKQDFITYDPIYGDKIYDLLHSQNKGLSTYQNFPLISEDEDKAFSSSNFSDAESESSMEMPNQRHPGRPKSQKPKKYPTSQGKLWEFIRDLLKNRETCPSLICWENYTDAKFRFVRSDEVAKLWGSRKGNTKMTYEKLSRAMRYYYKSKIFLPVLGRRLVYQFGPNAKGWQTDNPNFRR